MASGRFILSGLLWLALAAASALAGDIDFQFSDYGVQPLEHLPPVVALRHLPPVEVLPGPVEEIRLPGTATSQAQPESPASESAIPLVDPLEEDAKDPAEAKLWDGNFKLGLDGASGNTETFNFRIGLDAKRKLPDKVFTLDIDYHRGTNQGLKSANRLFIDWQHDWLWKDSPWEYFMHGIVEYDEFRAFNVRLTYNTGLSYKWIATDTTKLKSRAGGGFSRKVGGPDPEWVPELIFGLDGEHRIGKRHKLTGTVDYTPGTLDFLDAYRINSSLAWIVFLDDSEDLSLKFNVLDRYDNTPCGKKPNDFDYSIVLLWNF